MKNKYIFFTAILFSIPAFSQIHFRKGYDISFNVVGVIPKRDIEFVKAPWDTATYFSGGTTPCSGGLKHLTKIKQGGVAQSMLYLDDGHSLDIDMGLYPYVTMRIQTTCNKDIQMKTLLTAAGLPTNTQLITYTVKGGSAWNIIRMDLSDQKPLSGGTTNSIQTWWTEPAGTTYPYEIYIDYIKLGNLGDPDSTITLSIDTVPVQICEKDAGQQTINLAGISNGVDVSLLSVSQTNTKATLFESVTFGAIQSDGTCTMDYIPKAATIGTANMHVLLTYTRGDTVKKYKSVWFDLSVVADPKITVSSTVTAQMNQPKANIKVTNATNGTGGSSKLKMTASASNTLLITNLIAEVIKSDGTSMISFIPGQDMCGTDTITAALYDSITARTKEYKIVVTVEDKTGACTPGALFRAKDNDLKVYPNPAADKINVVLPNDNGCMLKIADITGRIVLQIAVPAGQQEVNIDLSQLNSGIYFIGLSDSRNKIYQKIIKE